MTISLNLFLCVISSFGCTVVQPQTLDRCSLLKTYIEDSKKTAIGNHLSDRCVFFVIETDSCLFFSVKYNNAEIDSSELEQGYLATYEGDYIYVSGSAYYSLGWQCLESIEQNKENFQRKIKERLLDSENLEYTTHKFPKRVIVKWAFTSRAIAVDCFDLLTSPSRPPLLQARHAQEAHKLSP